MSVFAVECTPIRAMPASNKLRVTPRADREKRQYMIVVSYVSCVRLCSCVCQVSVLAFELLPSERLGRAVEYLQSDWLVCLTCAQAASIHV